MLCLFVVFKNTNRRRMTQTNTKLNRLIERVNYLMRLSPQSSQIWGHLPSSGITSNIYKPLRRINQEGTGGALRPITSARPSGFVTVDLMDLCDAEGFQSCCFGTRPLLKPIPSSAVQRRTDARGWSRTALLTKRCDVTLAPCWGYSHLIFSRSWEGQTLRHVVIIVE